MLASVTYTVAQSDRTVVTAIEHSNEYDMLRLNDGEKWSIDPEMIKHIREGEAVFESFVQSGSRDFQELADQLADANSNLIMSCSMTGEAHNQLHLWLHPHLELTQKLKEADDTRTALNIVRQIAHSYELFNNYFKE